MESRERLRIVRIPQHVFLSRPDLWSREGLEEYLREQGIDPGRPYEREDIFVQDDVEDDALAA
jgi:hypothetical protein